MARRGTDGTGHRRDRGGQLATQGILGLHLDRQRAGPYRGTLARPGVLVTSRAGPGLGFYRGDESGGIRKRQSVTRQSDRFKLGRPGHVGLSGPGPLHFQSSSVLTVDGRLGCRGISIMTLQKVTRVLFHEASLQGSRKCCRNDFLCPPARPWVCGGLPRRPQPAPLLSQHVPSHPAATDPTAPAMHAVTVRARRDAPCEPCLGVIGSGNATRGRDPGDACTP